MTDRSPDTFPTGAPCGYMEKTGSWTIEIGVPEDTPTALNLCAQRMIVAFLEALQTFCRVTEARYDTIELNETGQPQSALEGQVVQINATSPQECWEQLAARLREDGLSYFTRIILNCDLHVYVPDLQGNVHLAWVTSAAEFYFGYVLEYSGTGQLKPVDGAVEFATHIDVWVERTMDAVRLQRRDNRSLGRANQPILERALRKWEALVGKPIAEATSRYYGKEIWRYGFRAET